MPSPSTQPAFTLCPGQGAQSLGMGKAWFEASNVAKQTFAAADHALGYSLSEICFDGPAEQLNRTDIAQPAIYTTSVACYQALIEAGTIPEIEAAAGLSLGEFTALHLAGAYDFIEGLNLVRLRGEAMQQAAEATEGAMLAITGQIDEAPLRQLCQTAASSADDAPNSLLVPANFNSPMQTVVTGTAPACRRAEQLAEDQGLKATPLDVAGAFHCPHMQPAAERLAKALDEMTWSAPNCPVYANVTAAPHDGGDISGLKQRLVEQLTNPVRWSQSMEAAIADYPEARFVELAPGKVLAGLMRRIDRKTKVENYDQPPY